MATMDPGQRGFGQQQYNMPGFASDIAADPLGQRRYNIPNLPFKDMRRQGQMPFADRLKRLFPQGQMPPELLQMLMMQLMDSQGGSMTPMGGGRPPQRPPMGGGRPPQRPPMGGGMPPQRPPMGGGMPPQDRGRRGGQGTPVVKLEDLMAAMTQRPPGTQVVPDYFMENFQANMPFPQRQR